MHVTAFLSNWDTLVLMLPVLALMALGMFGIDERITSPKSSIPQRHKFCGLNPDGEPFFSDPDGRPLTHPADRKYPVTIDGKIIPGNACQRG